MKRSLAFGLLLSCGLSVAASALAQTNSARDLVVEKVDRREAVALPAEVPEICNLTPEPQESQLGYMRRVATCFDEQGHPDFALWLLRAAREKVSEQTDAKARQQFDSAVVAVERRLGRVEVVPSVATGINLKNRNFMFDQGRLGAETGLKVWVAPGARAIDISGNEVTVDVQAGSVQRLEPGRSARPIDIQRKTMRWSLQENLSRPLVSRDVTQVPVYFITNRRKTGTGQKPVFGSDAASALTFGAQDVALANLAPELIGGKTIQIASEVSTLPGPSRLQEEKSFLSTVCNEWPEGTAVRKLLLFIHGYSNDFEDGVLSAAEVAANVGIHGKVVHFSWPSKGSVLRYFSDQTMEEQSRESFAIMLKQLRQECAGVELYLFAHSMGNRLLLHGLKSLSGGESSLGVVEVISAAADVAQTDYSNAINEMKPKPFKRLTLYASHDDHALLLSQVAHWGKKRAGQCGKNSILLSPWFQSVDATAAREGHWYYRKSPLATRDFKQVLLGAVPDNPPRDVKKEQLEKSWFWILVADSVAAPSLVEVSPGVALHD